MARSYRDIPELFTPSSNNIKLQKLVAKERRLAREGLYFGKGRIKLDDTDPAFIVGRVDNEQSLSSPHSCIAREAPTNRDASVGKTLTSMHKLCT